MDQRLDSLEGDVGEQRGSRADGRDAAANVGQERQNLLVLWIYYKGRLGNVLQGIRNTVNCSGFLFTDGLFSRFELEHKQNICFCLSFLRRLI